jgi:Icc-related predicted phosphoesterase
MIIYAVSDIHGNPEKLSRIRRNVGEYTPDVLVVAGDITNYHGHRRVVSVLNDMGLPVLAVRGNSDLAVVDRLLRAFPRSDSLHLKETVFKGVRFTGVSGAIPVPFRTRLRWVERPVLEQMMGLVQEHSILVAHPPPWGTLDEVMGKFHAGCRGLEEIVQKRQPCMLICGHIHERPGTARLGKTLVINCTMGRKRGGAMIDWDESREPCVRML